MHAYRYDGNGLVKQPNSKQVLERTGEFWDHGPEVLWAVEWVQTLKIMWSDLAIHFNGSVSTL